MPIYGVGDLTRAYDEGRVHTQFFRKNNNGVPNVQNQWAWGGLGVGNPASDQLIGTALAFTPRTVTNQSGGIWPGIVPPSGQTKHVVFAELRLSTTNATFLYENVAFFDMLGYYPLIDGNESATQTMDNTQTLPRYTDGVGVRAMLVSHISASTANGTGTINFIDADGASRSTTLRSFNNTNPGTIQSSRGGTATEAAWMQFDNTKGVRSITSVAWDTIQPGGYHAIVLVRPLFNVVVGGPPVLSNTYATMDKCFTCRNAGMFPQIQDGCALNWIWRHSSAANTTDFFGHITFAWG